MKADPIPAALAPLAVLLAALAAPETRTDLRYAPKAGTKLTRTFTNPGERTLASMKFVLGGEEHPAGDVEVTETFDEKVVLEDELVSVSEGRPTKIRRTFAEMTQSSVEKFTAGEEEHEKTDERKSDLAGATVTFTWDAEKEAYAPAFEGEGHDDALLADLSAEVDLAGLLPGKSVADGDSWTIPLAAFKAGVLRPAGKLAFHGDEPEPESERKAKDDMWAAIRGEARARFKGVREEDGLHLAVVEIEASISGSIEVEADEGRRGAQGTTVTFEEEFEGELLWDVERNLARSCKLACEGRLVTKTRLSFEMGDQTIEGEQESSFDVKETYEALFEAAE